MKNKPTENNNNESQPTQILRLVEVCRYHIPFIRHDVLRGENLSYSLRKFLRENQNLPIGSFTVVRAVLVLKNLDNLLNVLANGLFEERTLAGRNLNSVSVVDWLHVSYLPSLLKVETVLCTADKESGSIQLHNLTSLKRSHSKRFLIALIDLDNVVRNLLLD